MFVIKRDGATEEVSFDKILHRIKKVSDNLEVNVHEIAQKVCSRIYDGVKTFELDEFASQLCSSLMIEHPDYGKLASRLVISNHQKQTSPSFSETITTLYNNYDHENNLSPIVSEEIYHIVMNNKEKLNSYINYDRDYLIDYFGFKTLERAYLLKKDKKVIERPQHMWMRVALGIHGSDIKDALETYDFMSQKYFTQASPTLFNSGTPRQQMSSCFLLDVEDSIKGIYENLTDCAHISKYAGGIGLNVHDIRSKNSVIRGTNGSSDGIIPMLRVYNSTARYVNQCFTPETVIFTNNGSKFIKDINSNDYVITNDNTFQKVNKLFINDVKKDILKIKTQKSLDYIRVSKEHQIYCIKNQQKGLNYNIIKKRLANNTIKPVFDDASKLSLNDLVGYPIPKFNNEDIDNINYYRFIGILLGDGHITSNKKEFGITLNNITKKNTVEFVEDYLNNNNIHFWSKDNTFNQSVGNSYVIKFTYNNFDLDYDMIYDNKKEKYINKKFLNLNRNNTLYLIKGLLETDGHIGKEIYYSSSSSKLIYDLKYLLLKFGIDCSGLIKDNIGESHIIERENGNKSEIKTKKLSYVLRIPKNTVFTEIFDNFEPNKYNKSFIYNGIIWSRMKSIETEYYEGKLYDINVSNNHNYTVSNLGLVHNSGKRLGSIAIYLEPWHGDIMEWLDLRKNHGSEEERARDLFYALWISDLFMERVKNDEVWSLMCPDKCKGLTTSYGEEFTKLYTKYEEEGKYIKQVKAQDIWKKVLEAQIETGTPYMLYKDAINIKNNQKNIGTIKSSNLCAEITLFTAPDEIAVCNLASICLSMFVEYDSSDNNDKPIFNFVKLHEISKIVCKNLNKVIDRNFYPVDKAERSNFKHRPIGIGVQGLADAFIKMKYPFDSDEAKLLNKQIFETIYHGALESSMEISKKRKRLYEEMNMLSTTGLEDNMEKITTIEKHLNLNEWEKKLPKKFKGAYSSYQGSPASQGILQYEMWNAEPDKHLNYDWSKLKDDIQENGIRNSQLLALMPTASTSQIMGNNEAFEAITSNLYKRKTLAGEFILVNKYLVDDLIKLNLWNKDTREQIMISDGSIQNIEQIPDNIKNLYKTVWEIKQKTIIDMAVDRSAYICQTQSMNLFVAEPSPSLLTKMHFYTWSKGLKTGMYYLRTKPKATTQQFTIDPTKSKSNIEYSNDHEDCVNCGA